MPKFYRLTATAIHRLKFGNKTTCYRCEEPFKEGDDVVSQAGGRAQMKHYHQECWNSLFYEFKR